jgi:hypothetical protein
VRPTREGRHTPFRSGLIFRGLGVDPEVPVDDPEPPTNWAASSNGGQAFVPFLPPPEAGATEDLNLSFGTDSDGGGDRPVIDPTFANDGDLDTYAGRSSFFSGGTNSWWLEADLGSALEVTEIVVIGGKGNAAESDPIWDIEHSDDGSSWATAVGTYVWTPGVGSTPARATLTLTASATKRYWRIGETVGSGFIFPLKVYTWEINGTATATPPSNTIWVDAPLAIDGSDSTFEGVPQEHSPFLRHTLDDSYLIDRARLRVSWTSNTARTLTLQGANESDFSDAVTLDTHIYSPTGGLANPDDVNLAWSAANVYRYFQYLTSVENWYRVYESELYQAGDSTAVSVASNSLALGGVVVQNSASSNYHFVADSPTSGWWIPHDASGGASVSYGSNANEVSYANAPGASALVSRADHVHRGVTSLSHASNTYAGPVILTPGANVAITSPSSGTFAIHSAASGGGGAGSSAGGRQLVALPEQALPSTTGGSNLAPTADDAFWAHINLSAPMMVRALVFAVITSNSGTLEWGLFDFSSNAAAATKLVGGSGTTGGTGWRAIAATGAPVTVQPGSYALIFKAPSANSPTLSFRNLGTLDGRLARKQASYVWDDTPDLTTGWTDSAGPFVMRLVGDIDGSTQFP